ncbi:hypothetical protein GOV06_03720 [Candidatus Woesearchaeota archaeon]|nr:hypothetical protein [Candidatus Woesearchaeota archaeon]
MMKLRDIVIGSVLGASIALGGCYANQEPVPRISLECAVESLSDKYEKKLQIRKYDEVRAIVNDVVKDLTGEDVSDVKVYVRGLRHFLRIYGSERGHSIVGYQDPLKGMIVVRQGEAYVVLETSYHEIGHHLVKHSDNYHDTVTKKFKELKRTTGRLTELKFDDDLKEFPPALLMEETGAMAFERLGMLYTIRKFYKNGELGEDRLISAATTHVDLHSVANDVCNDIFLYLMEKERHKTPLELLKEMFSIIRNNDFEDIEKHLKPRTIKRSKKLFEKMQNPGYEF